MYRIRTNKNHCGNTYRKTLKSIIAKAGPEGGIVSHREELYAGWKEIGVAKDGILHEGKNFVDAFKCVAWWDRTLNGRHKFLCFSEILQTGEVRFPRKHCGLDNMLCVLKMTGAIEHGPDHYWRPNGQSDYSKDYHYVLTEHGRELGRICRELFV